jgi:O-antigen/teichoic acid export membrane protein
MSKTQAVRAGAWSALDLGLRQGVGFVVSIILARLLTPADFGLIALLGFFTSLATTFVQGGLSLALVQRQETTRIEESSVFWLNLAASVIFAGLLALLAPAVARLYEQPLLAPLLLVAGTQIVLSALAAVQTSLLTRYLRFDQLTKAGVVSSLLSGVLGVVAAYEGLGVWALAIQLVAASFFNSAALWWVCDWRPSLSFSLSSIRHLLGFGLFISLSNILEVLYSHGFALVIGKLYGVRDLGILNRANSVQLLPTSIISSVISRTALPLFSARAADKDALLRGLRMSIRLAMLLSMPVMAGLAILSDLVIDVLFGPKWMDAAPLLSIIAIAGMLLPLHILNLQLMLAQGQSRQFLSLEIQKKVAGIACLGVGSFFGIYGIAYASLVFSPVAFLLNAAPTRKSLGYGAARQLWDLRGIAAAVLFMSALVLMARSWLELPPLILLALLSAIGAVAYAAFGLMLRLPSFREAQDILLMSLRQRSGEPADHSS